MYDMSRLKEVLVTYFDKAHQLTGHEMLIEGDEHFQKVAKGNHKKELTDITKELVKKFDFNEIIFYRENSLQENGRYEERYSLGIPQKRYDSNVLTDSQGVKVTLQSSPEDPNKVYDVTIESFHTFRDYGSERSSHLTYGGERGIDGETTMDEVAKIVFPLLEIRLKNWSNDKGKRYAINLLTGQQ